MTDESVSITDVQLLGHALPVSINEPCVMVVKREQYWLPFPKTVTTEYAFTDGQMATEFERTRNANDDLRRSLKEATAALNLQKDDINGLKKTIQQLGNEAKSAASLRQKLATFRTKHEQLNQRHRKATNELTKEKQLVARLRSENTASLNKNRSLQRANDTLESTLEKTRQAHADRLKVAEQEQLKANQRADDAEVESMKQATVLRLIPKVKHIPFGVERLLHRAGVPVGPLVDLASYPPLAGPVAPFVRPQHLSGRYALEALCLSKERTNVAKSQDAMAFREVDGEFIVTVADGVSTSHRQSEWAHRIVRAGLALDPLAAIESAQAVHQEHERTLLELTPPAERWMAEASLGKPSHATLMRVHCRRDGSVRLQRCGDGWAAAYNEGTWSMVMAPSSVTGTNAAVSDQPFTFEDEVTVERPERLMVMTDGLNPTNHEGLVSVYDALAHQDKATMADIIGRFDDEKVFDVDDVTVVVLNFGGVFESQ